MDQNSKAFKAGFKHGRVMHAEPGYVPEMKIELFKDLFEYYAGMVEGSKNHKLVTFIVEGFSDENKIRATYPDNKFIGTIVLGGTKFNNVIKTAIEAAVLRGRVYILSDPDEAGDQIAKAIQEYYGMGIERILVNPDRARFFRSQKGWKYGVEYCSHEYVRELIGGYITL